MAVTLSSTAPTPHIWRRIFSIGTTKNVSLYGNCIGFTSRTPKRFVVVRSSSDGTAAPTEVEGESETSIEVPDGPPSLISALNVERALRGIPITDVDHYGRLGIKRGCSHEEVTAGYKDKVEELLSQGLDGEEVREKMELVKESYAILSTEDERRMYDWSLARSEKPDRYTWPFQTDILKPNRASPPPQEPEDVEPTRFVGYFLLAWLVLSFVLSIALNK